MLIRPMQVLPTLADNQILAGKEFFCPGEKDSRIEIKTTRWMGWKSRPASWMLISSTKANRAG